jgi:uncharacterized protein (TIGR00369 family)
MSTAPTRAQIVRDFVPNSPLVGHLGIELVTLEADHAILRLPYRPELATMGDVVHGGAIAALADTAGMVAAWADEVVPETFGGATASMSIDYLAPARAADVVADARVLRRGRRLCFCEVDVRTGDTLVAKALVNHAYAS